MCHGSLVSGRAPAPKGHWWACRAQLQRLTPGLGCAALGSTGAGRLQPQALQGAAQDLPAVPAGSLCRARLQVLPRLVLQCVVCSGPDVALLEARIIKTLPPPACWHTCWQAGLSLTLGAKAMMRAQESAINCCPPRTGHDLSIHALTASIEAVLRPAWSVCMILHHALPFACKVLQHCPCLFCCAAQ